MERKEIIAATKDAVPGSPQAKTYELARENTSGFDVCGACHTSFPENSGESCCGVITVTIFSLASNW